MDQRAPFISMIDDDDYTFDMVKPSSVHDTSSEMMGITETIFAPRPLETDLDSDGKPMAFVLKLRPSDCTENSSEVSERSFERHADRTKTKQPMETNRLETDQPGKSKDFGGILQRLLTSGKDEENGYELPSSQQDTLEVMKINLIPIGKKFIF